MTMISSYSGLARLAALAKNPTGNSEPPAMSMQALDQVLACFSEIDTESSTRESNKITYLEQMLRLQEPRHLSATQLSGRRFLLDMLRLLSQLPASGQSAREAAPAKDAQPRFQTLVYLLERTARPELAAKVAAIDGVHALDAAELVALVQWMDRYGITGRELALIQPSFFAGTSKVVDERQSSTGIHPQFAALVDSSQRRSTDYLAQAFLSQSEPLRLVPKPSVEPPAPASPGIGEALASIFDTPHDAEAATRSRLKAFFIPNQHGEPIIALSFE
jgi:hypothetical protein